MYLTAPEQPGHRLVRAPMVMREVAYCDLPCFVGDILWYSPCQDCIVVHGPLVLTTKVEQGKDTQFFLSNPTHVSYKEPINITDLRMSTFLVPALIG